MMRKLLDMGVKIARRSVEDNVTLYSAQAAYFVVVSVVPFIMLLVALVQFLVPESIQTLVDAIIMILPGELGDTAAELIFDLFRSTGTTISLAALISLWSASRGIMGLQSGLHTIYHVKERGNYFVRRGRCILYTFVFILAIVLALILLVLGSSLRKMLSESFTIFAYIFRFILTFRLLLTLVVFIVAFTFAYRYLTGLKCSFLEALPGVLLATVGWLIFSSIFSIYMTQFSIYRSLYGSLGAIILLFLWIYFCILILMIGAELNVYISERRHGGETTQAE